MGTDREVKDEVVAEIIKTCEEHEKKYGKRAMSIEELRGLCKKLIKG